MIHLMSFSSLLLTLGLGLAFSGCSPQQETVRVNQWEKMTLSFEGPELSEDGTDNPFLHYRLQVEFKLDGKTISVPGFFAADGDAAESGAEKGKIWQVRFRPDQAGMWSYKVSFRKGENVAISEDSDAGESTGFDGQTGKIEVLPSPDHPGRIVTTHGHYLQYAGSGKYFLKGGADSPENFLAYYEFDGTYRGKAPETRQGEATANEELHHYAPHLPDWKEGDPTWQGGKGKAIIGALNYLASKSMNSVYFLTMNIDGDGKDVWPYTSYDERLRFDCSKLDQWEVVFDHMDQLGLMLHVVTQETENEKLLDDGNTTFERKVYYRELIARFAHHLGVTWNMGEENGPAGFSPNGQNTEQQKAMVEYIKTHDPYQNFVTIHTHSNPEHIIEGFEPLLGFPHLDGISLQIGKPSRIHATTLYWREASAKAGRPWVTNLDELGPANRGIDPDDRKDNNQDTMRNYVLWGNLMAGGGGVEWYFGYLNAHNDLGCEDWRSRDRVWDYTRFALEFFHTHLPFSEMQSQDDLLSLSSGYCFAKAPEIYGVYLPNALEESTLDLTDAAGPFSLSWYNPREGGTLRVGQISEIEGG